MASPPSKFPSSNVTNQEKLGKQRYSFVCMFLGMLFNFRWIILFHLYLLQVFISLRVLMFRLFFLNFQETLSLLTLPDFRPILLFHFILSISPFISVFPSSCFLCPPFKIKSSPRDLNKSYKAIPT